MGRTWRICHEVRRAASVRSRAVSSGRSQTCSAVLPQFVSTRAEGVAIIRPLAPDCPRRNGGCPFPDPHRNEESSTMPRVHALFSAWPLSWLPAGPLAAQAPEKPPAPDSMTPAPEGCRPRPWPVAATVNGQPIYEAVIQRGLSSVPPAKRTEARAEPAQLLHRRRADRTVPGPDQGAGRGRARSTRRSKR